MVRGSAGFALFEAVLAVVLLGIGGAAVVRGALAVTRAVADGRRWTEAAVIAGAVLADLERRFRNGAPACVPPGGGARSGRGVVVSWQVSPLAGAVDVVVERRAGTQPGSVDTVRARLVCR